MSKLKLAFFLFLCGLLTSCSSVKKKEWADDGVVNKKYSGFAGAADAYLYESGFQGAVLVGRGDKIIFAKGYGVCDEKAEAPEQLPIGINTTFEAGAHIQKHFYCDFIAGLKIWKIFGDFIVHRQLFLLLQLHNRSGCHLLGY